MRALHEYYGERRDYDVVDEKVMVEANMYGLPFYGFTATRERAAGRAARPRPPDATA